MYLNPTIFAIFDSPSSFFRLHGFRVSHFLARLGPSARCHTINNTKPKKISLDIPAKGQKKENLELKIVNFAWKIMIAGFYNVKLFYASLLQHSSPNTVHQLGGNTSLPPACRHPQATDAHKGRLRHF